MRSDQSETQHETEADFSLVTERKRDVQCGASSCFQWFGTHTHTEMYLHQFVRHRTEKNFFIGHFYIKIRVMFKC